MHELHRDFSEPLTRSGPCTSYTGVEYTGPADDLFLWNTLEEVSGLRFVLGTNNVVFSHLDILKFPILKGRGEEV